MCRRPDRRAAPSLGHDVALVQSSDSGADDRAVLGLSLAQLRLLVTTDLDFGELLVRTGLRSQGVLPLRLEGIAPDQAAARIDAALARTAPALPATCWSSTGTATACADCRPRRSRLTQSPHAAHPARVRPRAGPLLAGRAQGDAGPAGGAGAGGAGGAAGVGLPREGTRPVPSRTHPSAFALVRGRYTEPPFRPIPPLPQDVGRPDLALHSPHPAGNVANVASSLSRRLRHVSTPTGMIRECPVSSFSVPMLDVDLGPQIRNGYRKS